MKQYLIIALALSGIAIATPAQSYTRSKYYNSASGKLDYTHGASSFGKPDCDPYIGFRVGPSFSFVSSDNPSIDANSTKTGLNIGIAAGLPLSPSTPLYLESGFYYTQKGGKGESRGEKVTYSLEYLEVPFTFKYKYSFDGDVSIQPYIGGYVACGVGGKIKDYSVRESYPSFSDDAFKRFDGGLRMGIGMQYDLFYAELNYDLGLANTCHDSFDTSHNQTLSLNFGVNF